MASQGSGILSYILTQLQTITVANGYTNDLSATDKVVVGTGVPTPKDVHLDPMVFVSDVSLGSERGPNLNGFTRVLEVTILGFKATSADTAISRVQAALDLAADIDTALTGTSARRSGGSGLFLDAYSQTATREGNSIGFTGLGMAVMVVSFEYRGAI